MLRNASAFKGYAIAASAGRLGTVSDFLFYDASRLVRWLVVDTGKMLSGRKVLLPPSVFRRLDSMGHEFTVGLTMRRIKDSPDDWTDDLVNLNVKRQTVRHSPSYEASAAADHAYEKQFHSHYDDAQPNTGILP
jgi:hypothetical protein